MANGTIPEGIHAALEFSARQQAQIDSQRPIEIDGRPYYFDNDGDLRDITLPQPIRLDVSTLTGFADYLKANPDGLEVQVLFAVIESYKSVSLYGPTFGPFEQRTEHVRAVCSLENSRRSPLDQYIDAEDAILWINANVVPDDERDALLKALAAIQIDSGAVLADDGVSQTVAMKTGARLVDKATLKTRIVLRPFVTFSEIEQPAREFVLRLDKGGRPGLFSADGDRWKHTAILSIRDWLVGQDVPCHILA